MTHRRAVVILLACTAIWGASFTLNKIALGSVSPMVLMATRFGISSLMLAWIYPRTNRGDWRVGLRLGILFAVQLALFFAGLASIPASRAAFLFSVQTPLVPLFVLASERRGPSGREIVAVGLATVGAWLVTDPDSGQAGLSVGDLLILASAAAAALYVVAAGRSSPSHEPLHLLAVQMPVMALLALVLALLIETPRLDPTPAALILIPFLALSSIATFGGQLQGQRLIRPTEAALIYAIEPIVAAGIGMFTLGERLGPGQMTGAGLILAGCLVVTLRGGGGETDRRIDG
jgi:drug/metabolite transporter (DMT)-like permease